MSVTLPLTHHSLPGSRASKVQGGHDGYEQQGLHTHGRGLSLRSQQGENYITI